MKIPNLTSAIIAIALFAAGAISQVNGQPPDGANNFDKPNNRGSIIARELGLSEMQRLEISQINQRQRLLLRDAQTKLRTARSEADTAIYNDEFNEGDVEKKIHAVALAQAEITQIRLMSEAAVRKVLSPDQLVKFRALRERFRQQRRRNQLRKNAAPRRNANRPRATNPAIRRQ